MRPAEASELVVRLKAAFPQVRLEEETIRLYIEKLATMNADVGRLAVDSAIATSPRFPSIAVLFEHYGFVREQRERDNREAERRAAAEAFDNFQRVPLREIPTVMEHLERNGIDSSLGLQRASDGKCDDCGESGPRCVIGKFDVCALCARSRLRAGIKLQTEAATAADST